MKVYVCFPEGKAKALTMSYDDGKIQDERLVSIFNRYGIRGTFNLNYGMIDKEGLIPPRIKSSRINELYAGHEIATHTMTHPTIARCPMTEVAEEILADRKGLEQITGRIIPDMLIQTDLTMKKSNSYSASLALHMPAS